MNDDAPMFKEIEELEAWFRTQCREVAPPGVEAIRQAVRCTLDEQRFAPHFADRAPTELPEIVKQRIRAELVKSAAAPLKHAPAATSRTEGRKRSMILRWSTGISAAAAMVAIWLLLPQSQVAPMHERGEVEAYVAFSPDAMDLALSELGDDIALLEAGRSGGSWNGLFGSAYDDVRDELIDASERM